MFGLAAVTFWAAGEEVSWGQRMFGQRRDRVRVLTLRVAPARRRPSGRWRRTRSPVQHRRIGPARADGRAREGELMRRIVTVAAIAAIACAGGNTGGPASGDPPAPLLEALQGLSSKRQLLAHQSVGANVLYGGAWDRSHGLFRLFADNPAGGVRVVVEPASLSAVAPGGWIDAEVGSNGDPLGKLDDFDAMVRTRFGGGLDYAAMKFCYVDFGSTTDVAGIWSRYQAVMDALEADFPGRIVHWTVPLRTTGASANRVREQLSDLIRGKYGATGRVFDFADLEKHDAQGSLVLVDGVPAMALEWSTDGGHLNDAFADRAARAYIELMYRVATRAAP